MPESKKPAPNRQPLNPLELQEGGIADLLEQIRVLNVNLERDIHSRSSWKLAVRNGLLGAVGGVVGSTILLAVGVHFFKPITELRPALERLVQQSSVQR